MGEVRNVLYFSVNVVGIVGAHISDMDMFSMNVGTCSITSLVKYPEHRVNIIRIPKLSQIYVTDRVHVLG